MQRIHLESLYALIQIAAFQSCFTRTFSDHAVVFVSPHLCVKEYIPKVDTPNLCIQ
jgi:hypothetical protein